MLGLLAERSCVKSNSWSSFDKNNKGLTEGLDSNSHICPYLHSSIYFSNSFSLRPLYLPISPLCLSICLLLSISPSVSSSASYCLSVCSSASYCLFVSPSVHLPVCLSLFSSACLSLPLFICLFVSPSVHLPVCLFLRLSHSFLSPFLSCLKCKSDLGQISENLKEFMVKGYPNLVNP